MVVNYDRKTFVVQATGVSCRIPSLDLGIMSLVFYHCTTKFLPLATLVTLAKTNLLTMPFYHLLASLNESERYLV
jgi:hypothetical protein